MDFWDKLTKKASETYKGASEKTNKLARETKLKLKINDDKSKINDFYKEIGKKVYQKYAANENVDANEDIREECEGIDALCKDIEECQKEILDLKNTRQCPNCNNQISKDSTFCPVCGAKQEEEPAAEVEVVETEETTNVEESVENNETVNTEETSNVETENNNNE